MTCEDIVANQMAFLVRLVGTGKILPFRFVSGSHGWTVMFRIFPSFLFAGFGLFLLGDILATKPIDRTGKNDDNCTIF